MKVLVTGASGHVGGNLVRALVDAGRDVRVLVRDDRAAIDGLPVEIVRGEVGDADSVAKAMHGVDTLFHLAARISILGDPGGAVTRTNVEGVRTVARAAREAGVRRMVHMSSCHAFDLDHTADIDERAPRPKPTDPLYNQTKHAGEQALREEIARGLSAVIVNPTGVIGPFDFKPSRMGRFFLALARGHLPSLVDGGFDFVDVRDLVQTTLAAETRGRVGENYLAGGRWVRVREVADIAAKACGVTAPKLSAPMWLARIGAPVMDGFGRVTGKEPLYTSESLHALRGGKIDSTKAKTELGHSPRPLTETIRDIYDWFARTNMLPTRKSGW
ncbi:MAG TPA: NAD-dependent epimerase/dehydratase family protein [Nannocystaceae bacterium]|nr:NAD-dependent epimerase/dehydratase family protein [Nannocystaceae bacterium]